MFTVRIAKGDVNSRKFLILQDLPNHVSQLDIGSNRELAYTIAVLISMGVSPKILLQFFVLAVNFGEPITFHADRERSFFQIAKLRAEIIPNDTVDDIGPIHFTGRCENLTTGQVPPLVGTNQSASLQPPVARF